MPAEEREEFINEKLEKRKEDVQRLKELNAKREEFIQNEMKNKHGEDSFSKDVNEVMKKQAKEKGVEIEKESVEIPDAPDKE